MHIKCIKIHFETDCGKQKDLALGPVERLLSGLLEIEE
jgi:hypothetical protein